MTTATFERILFGDPGGMNLPRHQYKVNRDNGLRGGTVPSCATTYVLADRQRGRR
jgi:hypothetical protein